MTDDAVKRLTKLGQRERIGRGSVEHEMTGAIGLKQIANQISNTRGQRIVAVRNGGVPIRSSQRGDYFRADPGRIVAREVVMLGRLHVDVDLANRVRLAQQTAKRQTNSDCLTG